MTTGASGGFLRISLFLGMLSCFFCSGLSAQEPDAAVGIPVKIYGTGTSTFYAGETAEFDLGATVLPSTTYPDGEFYSSTLFNGSGPIRTSVSVVALQPGKVYQLSVTALSFSDMTIHIAPPSGYTVYMNGVAQQALHMSLNGGYDGPPISICVVGPQQLNARAGLCSSIVSGEVYWQVALGSLMNGNGAGSIVLADPGTGSWANLFTPGVLQYQKTSAEVNIYRDATTGAISQIDANQSDVEIKTQQSSYELRFYPRSARTGSAPFAHTGLPYVTYNVSGSTSSTGGIETNQLVIKKTTHDASRLGAGSLSDAADDGTQASGPILVTQLTMTRTVPASGQDNTGSYVWKLEDWHNASSSAVSEEERDWGGTALARTETRVVKSSSGSHAVSLSVTKTFAQQAWGEVLSSLKIGSSAPTTANSYYTDSTSPGSYGSLTSAVSTAGAWEAYDYQAAAGTSPNVGVLSHRYRPFGIAPASFTANATTSGEVTTYQFGIDAFGAATLPTSIVTQINGTTVSQFTTTYSDAGTANGSNLSEAQRSDSMDASHALVTTTKYYTESDPNDFLTSQTYSVIHPDGVMQCFAYQHGTLSNDVFTPGSAPTDIWSRVLMITGNTSSGASKSAIDGSTIDPICLVESKSMEKATIRDANGLVRRQEESVWLGGNWQLVSWQDMDYDAAGFLTTITGSDGTVTKSSYLGDQALTTTDSVGNVTTNTYNDAGCLYTVSKPGAATTTYSYDASNRVIGVSAALGTETQVTTRTFDDSGRPHSAADPGIAAVNYSYTFEPTGWTQTCTADDGGTTKYSYSSDGRLVSKGGTAVIATAYLYSVANSEFLVETDVGGSSTRWSKTWRNWMNEPVEEDQSGFFQNGAFQEGHTYDFSTGHLLKTTRTGYADTLYQYDTMGNMILSGLDLDKDGTLTPNSADRIVGEDHRFELHDGNYWLLDESTIYPWTDSSSAANSLAVSSVSHRMTGFTSGRVYETRVVDSYGQTITRTIDVDATAHSVVTQTSFPGITASDSETVTFPSTGIHDAILTKEGLSSSVDFDGFGRKIAVTDPRSNVTTITPLTGTNLVFSVSDQQGDLTKYGYDSMGRLTTITDPSNAVAYSHFNTLGMVDQEWGTANYPVAYGYNGYGERTSMTTFRDGSSWGATTWPGAGSATLSSTTQWGFDPGSGLLGTKTDPEGKSVQYTYNLRGQLEMRKWARGVTATYSYYGDAPGDQQTGELKNVQYSDGTPAASYTYTRAGSIATISDGAGLRTFKYNNPSQPQELDAVDLGSFYNNRLLQQLYDSAPNPGRPVGFKLGTSSAAAADMEQDYVYNTTGLLYSITSAGANGGNQQTYRYTYKPGTNYVEQMSASGSAFKTTRYYEDHRDVLSAIAATGTVNSVATVYARFDYTRDARSDAKYAAQSGTAFADYFTSSYSTVYNAYTYDGIGQVTGAAMFRGTPPTSGAPSPSDELPGRRYSYTYDKFGNRQQSGPVAGTSDANDAYVVNDLNEYTHKSTNTERILGSAAAGATVTSSQGAIAMLDQAFGGSAVTSASTVATYNPIDVAASIPFGSGAALKSVGRNYLLPPQPQILQYDDDGNLTDDGVWIYSYDGENHIATATNHNPGLGGLPAEIAFTYDSFGHRVEKRVFQTVAQITGNAAASDIRFIYNGVNLIAEIDAANSGVILRSYTWGLDLSGSLQDLNGAGGLLAVTFGGSGGTNYFAASDGNGNIVALINGTTGVLAAAYEYSPFGETLRDQCFDSTVASNPIRFSSRYSDGESGLIYYGARYYDPSNGRFIGRDPIEEAGGLNLFGFCANDGLNSVDVGGMGPGDPPPVDSKNPNGNGPEDPVIGDGATVYDSAIGGSVFIHNGNEVLKAHVDTTFNPVKVHVRDLFVGANILLDGSVYHLTKQLPDKANGDAVFEAVKYSDFALANIIPTIKVGPPSGFMKGLKDGIANALRPQNIGITIGVVALVVLVPALVPIAELVGAAMVGKDIAEIAMDGAKPEDIGKMVGSYAVTGAVAATAAEVAAAARAALSGIRPSIVPIDIDPIQEQVQQRNLQQEVPKVGDTPAGEKVPLPKMKDSPFGDKIDDVVPKNGVPKNWTKDQIADAITDYQTSIASRRAEQSAFETRGNETQRVAHAQRITQEEAFLRSLMKALEN